MYSVSGSEFRHLIVNPLSHALKTTAEDCLFPENEIKRLSIPNKTVVVIRKYNLHAVLSSSPPKQI